MDKEKFENLLFSGFTRKEIDYLIFVVSSSTYIDETLSVAENARIKFKAFSYLLTILSCSEILNDLGDDIYAKKNS